MHLEAGYAMILMAFHLVQGTDYLVAIPKKSFSSSNYIHIYARADETGGTLHCVSPNHGWHKMADMRSWVSAAVSIHFSIGTITGVEYKAIIIAHSNNQVSLWIQGYHMSFSPLPTTALGTKYIVSSCYQSRYSILVIAAYNISTTVSIKAKSPIFGPSFNRLNTYMFKLKPFQTFTFEHSSDLTGTLVTSSQPVAVFSGMSDHKEVTAYEQLLPVRLYDKEYVVAVNENPALYHLKILSEQNETVITFNNGNSLTIKDHVHQYSLKPHERLYFRSSNPVMTTICRRNGTQSGFMVIPPVSLYSLRVVNLNRNYIFLTQKETFINSSYIRWTHIHNTGYKTSVLAIGSITTKAYGCNLVFTSASIRTDGFTFTQTNRIEGRKSFLVALPHWTNRYDTYLQLSSSQAASYEVVSHNQTQIRQILAKSSDEFYLNEEMKVHAGVENKAIRVDVDSDETQLSISDTMYGYTQWHSTIFPTSLLGREYILQACKDNTLSKFQLIIVSSSSNTDINILLKHDVIYDNIEYKPGDTIRVRLHPYQTLTINSSDGLCGTSVSASHIVAVFTLSEFGTMTSYNQLLPVEEFGEKYIVVANDDALYYNTDYYIIVTSGTGLTEVRFSYDLKVTVGDGVSYQKDLSANESVYFTSTKPVTTSLCNFNSHQCTVIVPTRLYTTESIFEVRSETVLNILTDRLNAQVNLTWSSTDGGYQNVSMKITWEKHEDYKIGIAMVAAGQICVFSTHRFTTLVFNRNPYVGEVITWNLFGWAMQSGGDVAATVNNVNTMAAAIGTTFGIVILILLAVIIYQHIYIRRSAASPTEKTEGRSGEHETSFSQVKPKDDEDVSTAATNAAYSDLHTEPQVQNNYESFNNSASGEPEVEYETF